MANHLMRATIHDVAKKAGVSSATASRVLSGSKYPVSEAARKRIMDAAEQLNYRPNRLGQMLQKNASSDIGIIVPNITNPFYTELVLGAESAAKERGFGLLLCNSLRNEVRELEYLESLCQKRVGGVIISSVSRDLSAAKQLIETYQLRVASLDQAIPEITGLHVDFQVRRAAREAVRFLIGQGHRRIALISAPAHTFSRKEFILGYRDALNEAALPLRPELELISNTEIELESGQVYEFENGKMLANKLANLEERPSAVLCVNDITAAGVLRRLGELNLRVPDDISVMGVDNTAVSHMVTPPLCTVEQSPFEAGTRVANALIDAIRDESAPRTTISITPIVVSRSSVKTIV